MKRTWMCVWMLWLGLVGYAQPDTTDILLHLKGNWKNGTESKDIPFIELDRRELTLTKSFYLPCEPDDSLYLYVEGWSWNTVVELNENFLTIQDVPFAPWSLALAEEWLEPEENILKISLFRGASLPNHPKRFLGMFQPPMLLEKSQLPPKRTFGTISPGDTVAILSPYFRTGGYLYDRAEAMRSFVPILKYNIKYVYFPFAPDSRLYNDCRELGLIPVGHLPEEAFLCLINTFPYRPGQFEFGKRFWLDEKGFRTRHYGTFFQQHTGYLPPLSTRQMNLLTLLFGLPFLALFILKLLNPGLVNLLWATLSRPTLYLDSFSDITSSNTGLLFLLLMLKVLTTASILCVLVFFLDLSGRWSWLSVIRDFSLIQFFLSSDLSLISMLGRCLGLVLFMTLVEYVVTTILSWAFQIKNFVVGTISLDAMSSYPLILALSLPVFMAFFVEGDGWQITSLGTFLVFSTAYLLRKVYIVYIGLGRFFSLSSGIKVLYICTFNILPYLIWL